jgi:hypothetical protein
MNGSGERRPGSGWGNGIKNNYCKYDWIAKILKCEPDPAAKGRIGCAGQAKQMSSDLGNLDGKLDDKWTFDEIGYGFDGKGLHFKVEGHSSNPNDPIIIIDPWRDSFGEIPRSIENTNPDER